MIVAVALTALADATGLSALAASPARADAALFVLALAGLIVGRRLSPRTRASRPHDDT